MYRLTVILGPNRGTSYVIQEGETTIGRQTGNVIVLSSARVSKRHCTIVAHQDEISIQDQESSNGTFVNGVSTQSQKIKPGDHIAVGDYVFELNVPNVAANTPVPALAGLGNVIQFPTVKQSPASGSAVELPSDDSTSLRSATPTDLSGKILWYFENYVMPTFYGLNLKYEWRVIAIGMGALLVLGGVLLSVPPLLSTGQQGVIRESSRRARVMAKQVVEKNIPALAAHAETKTEIGSIDREPGVRVAMLIDLNNRIIAPSSKMNQYLTTGVEGRLATRASKLFSEGRETGFVQEEEDIVAAFEPVKLFNPQKGRNEVVALAVVSVNTALSTLDFGEMGVVYSETLLFMGLLTALLFLILYRLTIKPFEVLNDDIDRVLKGELGQVTHEFRAEEFQSLWDNINSALQRVPKVSSGGDLSGSFSAASPVGSVEDLLGPIRVLGSVSKEGMLLCDGERKILYLNPIFEEISGIRLDASMGMDVPSAARDQAFGALTTDLFDRALPGGEGISEDFEFSGIPFRVHAGAFGSTGAPVRAFLLIIEKAGES